MTVAVAFSATVYDAFLGALRRTLRASIRAALGWPFYATHWATQCIAINEAFVAALYRTQCDPNCTAISKPITTAFGASFCATSSRTLHTAVRATEQCA